MTTMATLLHICGDFALRQSDYGINLVSLPGALRLNVEAQISSLNWRRHGSLQSFGQNRGRYG